jgi:Secretion system C-terminal sorting domain
MGSFLGQYRFQVHHMSHNGVISGDAHGTNLEVYQQSPVIFPLKINPNGLGPKKDAKIRFWPNPTESILHIEIGEDAAPINQIKVYSIRGELKQSYFNFVSDKNPQISFKDYASGIYWVEVTTENEVFIRNVVKK